VINTASNAAQHPYEFLYTTQSGTWLWRSTFLRRVFRPAVDGSEMSGMKAGCQAVRPGLTFHGLRHSHNTWLISGGAPELAQARRLGHHLDNRVTETYSHVAPEVEQRLLEDLERRRPHRGTATTNAGPGSSGNTAPAPNQRWGGCRGLA
jgi:integrase